MNGHVFQSHEEQNDPTQYVKTVEALYGYVKKEMKKYSFDLAPLFATPPAKPVIAKPVPSPEADSTDLIIFQAEVQEYVKRKTELQGNLAAIHAVAWGQCSEALKSKIKSLPGYEEKTAEHDCVWLLEKIASVMQKFEETRHLSTSLAISRNALHSCRQGPDQKVSEYIDKLRTIAETFEYHGGNIAEDWTMIVDDTDNEGNARTDDKRKKIARDWNLAAICMQNADRVRFGTLIANLANRFLHGHNEYPADLTEAQGLLTNYVTPVNAVRRIPQQISTRGGTNATTVSTTSEASAMTFVQGATVAGSNGRTHADIRCYNCNATGHYSSDCPSPSVVTQATTLVQYGLMMTQSDPHHPLDPTWILLDSQSTVSVFNNPTMLTNIRESGRVLHAITNGGFQESSLVGEFGNLGEVWYNADSIANILSLADVRKVCRVTMDSADTAAINVYRKDGTIMQFNEHPSGLYVFNPNASSDPVGAYTLVSLVAEQKKLFTRRQVNDADAARDLYRKIGRPSEPEFQRILRNNFIRNCPVTPADALRALTIYGGDVAFHKGTTTKAHAAPHVPTFEAVPLPPPILDNHRNVTVCADFFYVQGNPFLHTISRNIGYRTSSPVPDRSYKTILSELTSVTTLYGTRGFTVRDIHADHEFECIRNDMLPIVLDIVPADGHVGEIERSIRTIKERLRSCVHGLPFKRLPRILLQGMVAHVMQCLNQFPWDNGISDTLSPASIVTGVPLPDFNSLTLEFGSYVQVFEDNNPTNTPKARSLGAIALNPTGNANGAYYFLSLASGARISRQQWTVLPMTDTAIARVEALAKHEGQPLIQPPDSSSNIDQTCRSTMIHMIAISNLPT